MWGGRRRDREKASERERERERAMIPLFVAISIISPSRQPCLGRAVGEEPPEWPPHPHNGPSAMPKEASVGSSERKAMWIVSDAASRCRTCRS